MAENKVTMKVVAKMRVCKHSAMVAKYMLLLASPSEHKKKVEGLLDSVLELVDCNLVTDDDG